MAALAPQHKSPVVVPTFGGEGGGCVHIVVEDQNAQGDSLED